ncbi:MAG TPA: hypothetical protein VK112_02665 [Fodinibius sp.]|nr:hypothetical protein [Fodinibius sp.]
MLSFYYHKKSSFTEWTTEKMSEMVIAHKVVEADSVSDLPQEISPRNLPVLSDGHECWDSPEEIKQFLEQLHGDLKLSHSLQSDACHIDPDNPEECL